VDDEVLSKALDVRYTNEEQQYIIRMRKLEKQTAILVEE